MGCVLPVLPTVIHYGFVVFRNFSSVGVRCIVVVAIQRRFVPDNEEIDHLGNGTDLIKN